MRDLAWANDNWHLLAERALFWPAQRALILSDPHFGKGATFRRAGIPVPAGGTGDNLARLDRALAATASERLVIVGDLFHARLDPDAPALAAVAGWRAKYPALAITLVSGNHDRHAGGPPADWRMEPVGDRWLLAGVHFCHEPRHAPPNAPAIVGHVHPVVSLRDAAVGHLRLPCFYQTEQMLILPAFGAFTGGHTVRAHAPDRVFVAGADDVVEVPAAATRVGV